MRFLENVYFWLIVGSLIAFVGGDVLCMQDTPVGVMLGIKEPSIDRDPPPGACTSSRPGATVVRSARDQGVVGSGKRVTSFFAEKEDPLRAYALVSKQEAAGYDLQLFPLVPGPVAYSTPRPMASPTEKWLPSAHVTLVGQTSPRSSHRFGERKCRY
jgi:hypothetical protein